MISLSSVSCDGGIMDYTETVTCSDDTFQMVTPLFQPLRLWTPRDSTAGVPSSPQEQRVNQRVERLAKQGAPSFSIKGGFVSVAGGERRMVIAGKIFR
jgi:hypothetical protein